MEARRRRIAENEARFRMINEELRQSLDGLPVDEDDIDFVCECGEMNCSSPLKLTRARYERVRANPIRFAVLPGHEKLDVERVVERHDAYLVVEKHLPPGDAVAVATDPRG